jgi:hypothetical protein
VEALITWSWPGNVRELESAIMRAIPLSDGGRIVAADLGLSGVSGCADAEEFPDGIRTFKRQKRHIVEVFERQYLTRLMTEHCGNVSRAARAAGKERRDLGKLLKRHGLDARWFAGQVAGGEFIPARPRNPAGSPVFGRHSKVADGSEPIGILPNDLSGTIVKTRLDSRFAQQPSRAGSHEICC